MFHRAHDVGHPAFDKSIVLANCFAANNDRAAIIPDDEGAAIRRPAICWQMGHRNIGIITLSPNIVATQLRAIGMRRAFRRGWCCL